jgi:hypothetical protein
MKALIQQFLKPRSSREGTITIDDADPTETDAGSTVAQLESEVEERPICPICSKTLPAGTSNRLLNEHVDRCLSRATDSDIESQSPASIRTAKRHNHDQDDHNDHKGVDNDDDDDDDVVFEQVKKRARPQEPSAGTKKGKTKAVGKGKGVGGGSKNGLLGWLQRKPS